MGVLLDARRRELGVITAGAAFFAFSPALPDVPLCLVHTLSGVHCPTCGTTRALFALFRGDFAGAWAWNPVAYVVVAAALRRVLALTAMSSAWMHSRLVDISLLSAFFVAGTSSFLTKNALS